MNSSTDMSSTWPTQGNSSPFYPAIDHKLRLAGNSFEAIKALIDPGVAADRQSPTRRAYQSQ